MILFTHQHVTQHHGSQLAQEIDQTIRISQKQLEQQYAS